MTRALVKRALGRVLGRRASKRGRKLVLIYHSVGDSPWAVSAQSFNLQMSWLHRTAKLSSIEQLLNAPDYPLQVAVSFDDGYSSLHDIALPILKPLGAVATVFANTGCLGAEERNRSDAALGYYPDEFFLSWRDLRQLFDEGWTVGSHGVGHLDLTVAREEAARSELAASKSMIESIISVPCHSFAYTWGKHTPRLRRLVAESGYKYGFSGRHGPVQSDGDDFAIPRINISNEYTFDDFKSIVRGDWDYLGWIQRMKGL